MVTCNMKRRRQLFFVPFPRNCEEVAPPRKVVINGYRVFIGVGNRVGNRDSNQTCNCQIPNGCQRSNFKYLGVSLAIYYDFRFRAAYNLL